MIGRFGERSKVISLLCNDERYLKNRILILSLMSQLAPDTKGSNEEIMREFLEKYGGAHWFKVWTCINEAANNTGMSGIEAMASLRKSLGLEAFRTFTTDED